MKKTWVISGWVNEDSSHTYLKKDKVDILCEVKTGGEDCDGFQEEGIAVVLDKFGSLSMIRTGNCTGEDFSASKVQ